MATGTAPAPCRTMVPTARAKTARTAASAAVPAMTRTSGSAGAGETGVPLGRRSGIPIKAAAAAAARPGAKVTGVPAWRYLASCRVTYGESGPPLTQVPVQELPGQPPCRPTRSKVAVASVGAAVPDALVICWLVCCAYPGEVANSPACTVGASPGRVTAPILVQLVPPAES